MNMQAKSTSDGAFEAEARRMGKVFFRRQWRMVLVMLVAVLLWLAGALAVAFLVPSGHPNISLLVFFGGCGLGFVALDRSIKRSAAGLRRLLAVTCPECGGAARFETARLPDTHIYMVCPQCGRRADTGFKVSKLRNSSGRYSMGYNWESRKFGMLMAVRVRRRRGGKTKVGETRNSKFE
jgi:hypothetical protein